MKLDFAFLADTAEVINGKLYVMGGAFDTLWLPSKPFIQPRLSLVMKIEFSPNELDRTHKLEIILMNADGKKMATVNGEVRLSRNPKSQPGYPDNFISVINFNNLKFDDYGDYSFDVMANDTSLKSIPLRVVPTPS